ncbi:hypothetical protein E1286_02140 [Nonomuraea terrae]|uniref:Beta-lactamase-related domain-containing protein n=1 Tax=Nonomuraea terrae TaxID=2530383 RepID=A0A4R4ZGC6_9ACTN|nr:hypothetical protein [Nonomuraea terrae]TDD56449.1 hypothetical protein E1286_02140 [Nonomuraea terrae]
MLHGGRGLVPAGWMEEMTRPRVTIEGDFAYGYQWYVTGARDRLECIGNGGRRLVVVPGEDLVVAVTAGDHDREPVGTAAVLEAVLG